MEKLNEIEQLIKIQTAILAGNVLEETVDFKKALKILKDAINKENSKLSQEGISILNAFFECRNYAQSCVGNNNDEVKRKAAFIILSTASYWYFSKKWENNCLVAQKTQEIRDQIASILNIKFPEKKKEEKP